MGLGPRSIEVLVLSILAILAVSISVARGLQDQHGGNPETSILMVSQDWMVIGQWRITQDDDPSYAEPDCDDASWTLFGSKTINHFSDTGGVYWYRARFTVPAEWSGSGIVLRTGWIADAADIYLNGETLARNLLAQYSATNMTGHPVSYPYPGRMPKTLEDISRTLNITGLINYGDTNLLAIRLTTGGPGGGVGMLGLGIGREGPGDGYVDEEGSTRILLLGDSITDQSGYLDSYPRKVWDAMNAFFPGTATIINFGRNAETSSRGLGRLPQILEQRPASVLINLGVNDVWWAGTDLPDYERNIDLIVGNLSAAGVGTILLSTATPIMLTEEGGFQDRYEEGGGYAPRQREFNGAINSIALARGLNVIPFNEAFVSLISGPAGNHSGSAAFLLQRDGVHPNAWGASVMARLVLENLFPMTEEHLAYLDAIWDHGPCALADTQAPVTTIDAGTGGRWYTEGVNLSMSPGDPRPGTGVSVTLYSIDGGDFRKYAGPFAVLEGNHTYTYFSADNAGNVEEPKDLSIAVDTGPPLVELEQSPLEVSPTDEPVIVATVTEFRGVAGIQCIYALDGGPETGLQMDQIETGIYHARLPRLSDNTEVSYRILATDLSGHAARTETHSYRVGEPQVGALAFSIIAAALCICRRIP